MTTLLLVCLGCCFFLGQAPFTTSPDGTLPVHSMTDWASVVFGNDDAEWATDISIDIVEEIKSPHKKRRVTAAVPVHDPDLRDTPPQHVVSDQGGWGLSAAMKSTGA